MRIITHFEDYNVASEYIKKCEQRFKGELTRCIDEILNTQRLRFIMLSGPTCSGKTTAAQMLADCLKKDGRRVFIVSIDDFFYSRAELNKRETLDYDSVESIDLELFKECVSSIHDTKPTYLPIYDFKYGRRSGKRLYEIGPKDITIFEGIQALYPEITNFFDKSETRSIYISVSDKASLDCENIPGRTVRLFRRIFRDYIQRSTSPDFSLKIWNSVCDNEDKSINPYKDKCDFKIDSLLGYELSILKEPVSKLLKCVSAPENKETAQELLKLLSKVDALPDALVPSDSLFNEFLGK